MKKEAGFGLAKIKVEGEIADPDDFEWEHDPHTDKCEKCTAKYHEWKRQYDAQELKKNANS